jgi:sugar/nucleoside kinase (ribokinase family)
VCLLEDLLFWKDKMMSEADKKVELVIVGSIGIDTIETPFERREDVLGGSISYACAASSFYAKTGMVGVVGTDFPAEYRDLYSKFGIDLDGLQTAEGDTFRWSGVYEDDLINRRTISTDLNVFADFSPELPESYVDAPYVLLGNISPELQLHVLDQVKSPKFVVADTMDLWISIARDALVDVISKVDMLMLNDSEVRMLTGEHNLVKCANMVLDMGPKYVVVKKGEHGAMLVSRDGIFMLSAYPIDAVVDPTGAGDSFAGAFMGSLVRGGGTEEMDVRRCLLAASTVASFACEGFGLDLMDALDIKKIDDRQASLAKMMAVG